MEGVLNMSEQNLKQVLAKKQSILQGRRGTNRKAARGWQADRP